MSPDVSAAALGQVGFEIALTEPQGPADPKVRQASGARQVIDRGRRQAQQLGHLLRGE
jgi:hypothetical protein